MGGLGALAVFFHRSGFHFFRAENLNFAFRSAPGPGYYADPEQFISGRFPKKITTSSTGAHKSLKIPAFAMSIVTCDKPRKNLFRLDKGSLSSYDTIV